MTGSLRGGAGTGMKSVKALEFVFTLDYGDGAFFSMN